MIGSFSFDGVLAENFNLVCRSVKRPLLPHAKVKRVELAGASGAYDFDGNEYGLRQVTMRIVYLGKSFTELRSKARLIAAWLCTHSWARLIINDEPDKYYLAKVTDEIDLQSLWEAGTADISFDCQPFAYSITEESKSFGGSGGTFYNPGTREINYRSPQGSKFLITVTGNNMQISMNGATMKYSGSGTLTLDNIEMEAKLGGTNVFHQLTGDIDRFFKIVPRNNSISATGASSILVNYIPMWY